MKLCGCKMQIRKVPNNIKHLKPNMTTLGDVSEIPINGTVTTAKIDGEMTGLFHHRERTFTLNTWGTMREDFPVTDEAREILVNDFCVEALILGELYAVKEDEETPIQLPAFLSLAKGKNADPERLRFAPFEILTYRGEPFNGDYKKKLQKIWELFNECKYIKPPPFTMPDTREALKWFWEAYVVNDGYEGLVARRRNIWYKVKPQHDVDVVILAANKTDKWHEKRVTSLKTGLLLPDGRIVEITDVSSGLSHKLQKDLWKLHDIAVEETSNTLWVKPQVIITVTYTETFKANKPTYNFENGKYLRDEDYELVSLRHPRFRVFRPDKSFFNEQDLRVSQIPQ